MKEGRSREESGSIKSTRSRLDSHLVAGSQCPCYLLHDSLPYLHQSPTQGGKQKEGGWRAERDTVCLLVYVSEEKGKEEGNEGGKEGEQTKK